MRPTRPSWKPSGPSHRRSPSHRASDFLTHPNRHLFAFRRSVQGLWTLISSYCIHPSLLCRDTLSLRHSSLMHPDAARGTSDLYPTHHQKYYDRSTGQRVVDYRDPQKHFDVPYGASDGPTSSAGSPFHPIPFHAI